MKEEKSSKKGGNYQKVLRMTPEKEKTHHIIGMNYARISWNVVVRYHRKMRTDQKQAAHLNPRLTSEGV